MIKSGSAILDIECVKIKAPAGWVHPMRFKTILVGLLTSYGITQICDPEDQEAAIHARTYGTLRDQGITTIYIEATRQFDYEVLEGTWTSARRAVAPAPGPWPSLDLRRSFHCITLKPSGIQFIDRTNDILSKDVPAAWKAGNRAVVLHHNTIDLINTLRYLKP